jgi:molybdate transport system substrate-binding protein
MRLVVAVGLTVAATACGTGRRTAPPDVLVFAASSLKDVVDDLAPLVEASAGARMRVSYAASSSLARQIEEGAPAEIFVSADLDWMDYLAARNLIQQNTRVDLTGNRLVLIAPAGRTVTMHMASGFPLAAALGGGRLAIADPEAVPAGKYAKAALTSLGVWDAVATRLAPAENVRAALTLVSRAEAPLGVVYHTDALADPGVVIVDTFPPSSHPAIVYPAALTTRASPAAARVLGVLRGDEAHAVFKRRGFVPPLKQ